MWDSNPRAANDLTVFKTVPFSQTWVIFQKFHQRDSNPRLPYASVYLIRPLEPSQFNKVGDTIPIVARKLLETKYLYIACPSQE